MKRAILVLLALCSTAGAGGPITGGPGITVRCSTNDQVLQWSVASATWVCSTSTAITGSGVSGRVSVFNGTDTITGYANLTSDSNGNLSVNTLTTQNQITLAGNLIMTQASTDYIYSNLATSSGSQSMVINASGTSGIVFNTGTGGFTNAGTGGLALHGGGSSTTPVFSVSGTGVATIGAGTSAGTISEVVRSGSLSGVLGYSTDVVVQIDAANPHNDYINFTAAGAKGLIFSNASGTADGYMLYDQTSRSLTFAEKGTIYQTLAQTGATYSSSPGGTPLTINSTGTGVTNNTDSLDIFSTETLDTTAAGRQATGIYSTITSTRSAGANNLTNVAAEFNASGGQVNTALQTDAGNVLLNAGGGSTTITGGTTITPPASTVGLVVNGVSNTNGANFTNTSTAQTTATNNINATVTGSFNTTSAALQPAAVSGSISSTRSAGANNLTNTAFLASATGGQANYAFYGSAGDFFVAGNGTFGGEVFAATASGGNTALKTTGITSDFSALFQRGSSTAISGPSGTAVQVDTASGAAAYIDLSGTGAKGIAFSNSSTALDGYVRYDVTSRQIDIGAANADMLSADTNGLFARSSKNASTITLSTGTGTATVRSGTHCVCTDTTANASVKCAVSSTTLTATGTGSDVIAYLCF